MASLILDQLATYGPAGSPPMTCEQAAAYNARLAKTHYENFTVISWLLPARLREGFGDVYAFCRWADDLGDETGDRARSLELLAWWRHELDLCYEGRPRHPVFIALRRTITRHDIPRQPFDDLIDAFMQDQRIDRYQSWDQLLDYCSRSANPVGRLVLHLCGHRDPERQRLSDATCTALQLANFWQDVRSDALARGRVYIPEEAARRHGLDIELMTRVIAADAIPAAGGDRVCCTAGDIPSAGVLAIREPYRATLRELCQRTWPLFEKGRELLPMVEPDVRMDIALFGMGGQAILRKIQGQDYDTLTRRPTLGKLDRFMLLARAAMGRLTGSTFQRSGRPASHE